MKLSKDLYEWSSANYEVCLGGNTKDMV